MGEIRANYQSKLAFAKQQLDWYNKHWGTAKGSASWVRVPQEVIALKDEVAQYRERITYYTKRMGDGKTADGEWVVNKGAKGIQARCALAALKARGKIPDPGHSSASGVPHPNCVHETKNGECSEKDNLAFCYHCFQPLCPHHRFLVGKAKEMDGKRLGGATCCCKDQLACHARSRQQQALLSLGMDAQGAKGRGEAARHEKKEGASVKDTHHGSHTGGWGTQWRGCDAQWGSWGWHQDSHHYDGHWQ